jgi:hypothetical protein
MARKGKKYQVFSTLKPYMAVPISPRSCQAMRKPYGRALGMIVPPLTRLCHHTLTAKLSFWPSISLLIVTYCFVTLKPLDSHKIYVLYAYIKTLFLGKTLQAKHCVILLHINKVIFILFLIFLFLVFLV